MQINEYQCKMCGRCCRNTTCEIVPDDLPRLLERFNMTFKEFFKKYLIAVPCNTGDKADTILRLCPVRKKNGKRYSVYLEDENYMDEIGRGGECIFLNDNKCTINDIKPLGGRIMKCRRMTGGLTLQLTTSQYFIYWYNNQQIFYELSEEVADILKYAEMLYKKADKCYEKYFGSNKCEVEKYEQYVKEADNLMNVKLKDALNKL